MMHQSSRLYMSQCINAGEDNEDDSINSLVSYPSSPSPHSPAPKRSRHGTIGEEGRTHILAQSKGDTNHRKPKSPSASIFCLSNSTMGQLLQLEACSRQAKAGSRRHRRCRPRAHSSRLQVSSPVHYEIFSPNFFIRRWHASRGTGEV